MELYGVSKEQLYIFNRGEDYQSYNVFGSHIINFDGKKGVRFLVYAPNAINVYVVGDFNNWEKNDQYKMQKIDDTGCYIIFIEGLKENEIYKYLITTRKGIDIYKSDPYAFYAEVRPNTASKIYDINGFKWSDEKFIIERSKNEHFIKPKNIYEVHLGSFLQHRFFNENKNCKCGPLAFYNNKNNQLEKNKNIKIIDAKEIIDIDDKKIIDKETISATDYFTYRELTSSLLPYVKKMGYTHIEIMPLNEFPYDGSWGYQDTGYFAITSRYGTPKDFMFFVNECHKNNISVILDWVPGHYCMDDHGLRFFDGDRVYDGKEHKHWGTMTFNYAKKEVLSFLNSSAIYLIDKFHIDGIRFDGVSSMLYLNYGVENPKERVFNKYGDEGNLEAIEFIQNLNAIIGEHYKGVITIAEESTAWPNVTKPREIGGLGFHYKWDMGWMHDTLNYLKSDFPYREKNHNMITFSMSYAESENYVLSLSHDEVVHGKASIINKMPGDYDEKFAQIKVLLTYQMTRPGVKLNFMGNEIPEFIEWRYYESLEWFLLDVDKHKKHNDFVCEINNLYKNEKSLWENDINTWDGFQWIDASNAKQHIFIYERIAKNKNDRTLIILNFGKENIENFRIGVNKEGKYKTILNSSDVKWGGDNLKIDDIVESEKVLSHGKTASIVIEVPKLTAKILKLKK